MSQRKTFTLAVDLDDTLSCFGEHWISVYNQKSGDSLKIEEITDWDITKFVLPDWKDKIFSEEIVFSEDFFLNVPVKDDAVDFMKWACENFNVFIVSDCHLNNFCSVHDKAKWITKHFAFFDIRCFIPCYHKNLIKADFIIDDAVHNLINFDGEECLIDRPWNRKYIGFDKFRFSNIQEIARFLKGVDGENARKI